MLYEDLIKRSVHTASNNNVMEVLHKAVQIFAGRTLAQHWLPQHDENTNCESQQIGWIDNPS